MTERLYYRDATLLEFDATVVAHDGDPSRAILDRTAFYPTSGGQPHDTGTLNGIAVTDVIDRDDDIIHVLAAPLALGAAHGAVDRARRQDHMEQHSAQHLLSALAADRWHWETSSVHFGALHSTIELATAAIPPPQLTALESAANAAVAAAHPIHVTFEDVAAASARGLRKASDRDGELRIISIDQVDRSACGGTHLSSTSAIGAIALLGVEKVRGNSRIAFIAGKRVLDHLHRRDRLVDELARTVGCATDELAPIVATRQQELAASRKEITALEIEVAAARLGTLLATTAAADGVRRMKLAAAGESATLLRAMAQQVAALARASLVIADHEQRTVFFATSGDTGLDAGATLKPLLAAVGGRGGGNARLAQGSVPDAAAMQTLLDTLHDGTPR